MRSALRRHATKLEKGEDLSANIANEDNDAFRTNEDKEISRSMFVYDKIETQNGGFDVIFDSGSSIPVTPSRKDFESEIREPPKNFVLKGITKGLPVQGIGILTWYFVDD
ncbi:MAG: hypothetical protein ACREOZ_00910, partial [Gloeomargaritales cyanobacterium]